ncbi:hypothetical protein PENTCL1PPCAC_6789, partial [Pristionchus entomophagus]
AIHLTRSGHKSLVITVSGDEEPIVTLYGSLAIARSLMKSNWNGMDSDCRLRTECGIVPIVGSLEFGEHRGEIEEGDNLRAAIVTILDHEFFPAKEHYSRDPPVWWPVEVPYSSFYHGREESTVGAPLQQMRVVLGEYKKFVDARRRGVVDGDMA